MPCRLGTVPFPQRFWDRPAAGDRFVVLHLPACNLGTVPYLHAHGRYELIAESLGELLKRRIVCKKGTVPKW